METSRLSSFQRYDWMRIAAENAHENQYGRKVEKGRVRWSGGESESEGAGQTDFATNM